MFDDVCIYIYIVDRYHDISLQKSTLVLLTNVGNDLVHHLVARVNLDGDKSAKHRIC